MPSSADFSDALLCGPASQVDLWPFFNLLDDDLPGGRCERSKRGISGFLWRRVWRQRQLDLEQTAAIRVIETAGLAPVKPGDAANE